MAFTTIDDPTAYFQVELYTGTGSSNARTFDSDTDMQPDLVWIKERSGTESPHLSTSVQGATYYLQSNTVGAEGTAAEGLKSFDSDGFTVGTQDQVNTNTETYVAWCWKAGTTSGISTNASTTITPSTYSFDQTAGISIIEYTGNGTAGAKVAHGLGAIPQVFVGKIVTPYTGDDWTTFHHILGNTKNIPWNATNAAGTATTRWNDTSPDSVNMTLGTDSSVNQNTGTQIAYVWTGIQGFSKFGGYTGNGNADGPFIYTGFRPAYILIKNTEAVKNWQIYDNKRSGYNKDNDQLFANTNAVEDTGEDALDILSNGFKIRVNSDPVNLSGDVMLYYAFAEAPFVNSEGVPCNAR
jgi:hypothetical protein